MIVKLTVNKIDWIKKKHLEKQFEDAKIDEVIKTSWRWKDK